MYPRAQPVSVYIPGARPVKVNAPSSPLITVVRSSRLVTGAMVTRPRARGCPLVASSSVPLISKSPAGRAGCCATPAMTNATHTAQAFRARTVLFLPMHHIHGHDAFFVCRDRHSRSPACILRQCGGAGVNAVVGVECKNSVTSRRHHPEVNLRTGGAS